MSFDLVPIADIEKMAAAIATSRLFGAKTKEEAMAIMLIAQAEGMHPAAAARDYHIIQGRPAMKADAMMARYINTGGKVEWHDYTDEKVSATFSHPNGGTVKIEWTIVMAKRIGLANKDNWRNYPRQMLRARTISEGVRTTNPAVAVGIYTPEEVRDMPEKDMGPAEVVVEKISEAQHKRLEAIIVERGLDREVVKEWILKQFGKLHFPDLSDTEYAELDLYLLESQSPTAEGGPSTERAAGGAPKQESQGATSRPAASAPTGASAYVTADQALELEAACQEKGLIDKFKERADVMRFSQVLAADYEGAKKWIAKQPTP